MEINEVKIGDVVSYKNKKGKMMKGTVIHRHEDKGNLALMGMVNVKPLDDESYPETVHVSTIKKAIKEETNMEHIREAIDELIGHVESGNHVEAEKIFQSLLQDKVDALLDAAKVEVASTMFNTQECAECSDDVEEAVVIKPTPAVQAAIDAYKKKKAASSATHDGKTNQVPAVRTMKKEEVEQTDEALKGGQHKIDMNKNGKLDAHDFKMLRGKKKGMKEEVEQMDEASYSAKMARAGKDILRKKGK